MVQRPRLGGVEDAIELVGPVRLALVERQQRAQRELVVVVAADDIVADHVHGVPVGLPLTGSEESADLVVAVQCGAARVEHGVGSEQVQRGGGLSPIDRGQEVEQQCPALLGVGARGTHTSGPVSVALSPKLIAGMGAASGLQVARKSGCTARSTSSRRMPRLSRRW